MEDGVQLPLHVEVLGYVLLDEAKVPVPRQVFDVGGAAGDQVVHDHHLVPFSQEPVAQMRTQKSGAAGDEYPHGSSQTSRSACSPMLYHPLVVVATRRPAQAAWWLFPTLRTHVYH